MLCFENCWGEKARQVGFFSQPWLTRKFLICRKLQHQTFERTSLGCFGKKRTKKMSARNWPIDKMGRQGVLLPAWFNFILDVFSAAWPTRALAGVRMNQKVENFSMHGVVLLRNLWTERGNRTCSKGSLFKHTAPKVRGKKKIVSNRDPFKGYKGKLCFVHMLLNSRCTTWCKTMGIISMTCASSFLDLDFLQFSSLVWKKFKIVGVWLWVCKLTRPTHQVYLIRISTDPLIWEDWMFIAWDSFPNHYRTTCIAT